jgi:hypothetical protein
MTSTNTMLIGVLAAASGLFCLAQSPPTTPPPDTKAAPADGAVVPPPARPVVPPREVLEKEFENALTGATLEGVWQMTTEGGLKAGSGLTDPKPDKYTIKSANKTGDDNWVIVARIDFGKNEAFIPVPVRVVWAEDTAIITLNDLTVPMIGTYSARVMVHKGFYSGVWYCNEKNYGGVMQGRISKTSTAPASKPASAPTPRPTSEKHVD